MIESRKSFYEGMWEFFVKISIQTTKYAYEKLVANLMAYFYFTFYRLKSYSISYCAIGYSLTIIND